MTFAGISPDRWLDPELLKYGALRILQYSDTPWIRKSLASVLTVSDPILERSLWGLTFPNPLGLAAGFDKDGRAAGLWPSFGFGFAEIGTVTPVPQEGNPRPRLFRLSQDRAVLNRIGFASQGCEAVARHLETLWSQHPRQAPLGINLGKAKVTPLEDAAQDYCTCFLRLQALGDYFVVNVSSPNTPGLRSLQTPEALSRILEALQTQNSAAKPLLVKIAPDLPPEDLLAIVEVAHTYELAGLIATNTTLSRDYLKTQILPQTGQPLTQEAGGISGAPLRDRSTEVIRFLRQHTDLPIIGVGGIFTVKDAWEKLEAGATLLQVYTGWIYEGPWMVKRILTGLQKQLQQGS